MRLLLTALGCSLAVVPAAHGWVIEGERWPGPTVAVWNGTAYAVAVRDAMRAWGSAGADIRRVAAPARAEADVVIVYGSKHEEGLAAVGYGQGRSTVALPRGLGRVAASALAAHEHGHVLGLGHEARRCAVMAPVVVAGPASRCGIGACKETWRCLLRPDDVAGLVALYGRRASA